MNQKEVVFRINYFRNKRHLSARELSLRLGKSASYINRLESHAFTLTIPVLTDILKILEVTAEEFFSEDFHHYQLNYALLKKISALPAARRELLLQLADELSV